MCDSLLISNSFTLPHSFLNVKHFFEDFLKFLGEPIDLRTFPVTFLEVFVPDVRLTVMYFSTASFKKQALFYNFYAKIILLTFCPVFYIFYRHFLPYSSKSRARSRIRILRSRREICTCVVCSCLLYTSPSPRD